MSNRVLFIVATTFISVGFQVSLGLLSSLYASDGKENVSTISLLILQISVCVGSIVCHKYVNFNSSKKVMIVSGLFLSLFVLFAGFGNEYLFYTFSVLGGFANGIFSVAFLIYMNLICSYHNRSVFINLTFAAHVLGNFVTFTGIRIIMPYCETETIIMILFVLILLGIYVILKVADISTVNTKNMIQHKSPITNYKIHLFFLLCISTLIGFVMGLNFSLIPIKVTNLLGKEAWTEICLVNTTIFFVLMLLFCKFKIIAKIGVGVSGLFIGLAVILYIHAEDYWQFVVMEIILTFGVSFYWGSVIQITNDIFKHHFDFINGPRNAAIFLASALGISLQYYFSDVLFEILSFIICISGIIGGIYLSYQVLINEEKLKDTDDDYQMVLD